MIYDKSEVLQNLPPDKSHGPNLKKVSVHIFF